MNQDDLRALVTSRGGGLAQAVYAVHGELLAQEPDVLACGKSCSVCCRQLFGVTNVEWQEIRKYLIRRGLARQVKVRNRERLAEWQAYLRANRDAIQADALKPFGDHYHQVECVFLNERQLCDVYPVRPMNCRTMTSLRRCTAEDQGGAGRLRWEWEKHLVELLWEHDSRARVLPDLLMELTT